LKISDGVGGELKICGSDPTFITPKRASRNARDLYITLQTSGGGFDRLYKGFKCDLTCVPPDLKVEDLPDDGVEAKEDSTCGESLNAKGSHINSLITPCSGPPFSLSSLSVVCGIMNNKEHRIVGGEDAKRDEFEFIGALVTAGTRKPFCGKVPSSIFSPQGTYPT
jgi:hypothetical protein